MLEAIKSFIPDHLSRFEVLAGLASIIGVPLALLGLVFTWLEARKAKNASSAASTAVSKFRDDLGKVDLIAELHRSIDGIADIKRFLRASVVAAVPDRLAELRRSLINCRTSPLLSSDKFQSIFQDAISFLATEENNVESLLAKRRSSLDLVRVARDLTSIADNIQSLLLQARTTIGNDD